MFLEEYLKKKFQENNINLELYIKIQNIEILKNIAKKEKLNYKDLFKKYIR